MNPVDVRKVVEQFVNEDFLMEHDRILGEFLDRYGASVARGTKVAMSIGMTVNLPPETLDLRQPVNNLIDKITGFILLTKINDDHEKR